MSTIAGIPHLMYEYALNKPPKVIHHISPSQIGRCMRAHYYAIKHVAPTTRTNVGALLNFEVGFLWEDVMERALKDQGIPFISQYKMYDETLDLEGTLDFAPYDQVNNWWEIWDSKTEATGSGVYRRKRKVSFFEDHPEYVHQLNSYCILMRNKGFKIGPGRFGIISKDNGSITEEVREFEEESLRATLLRITTLKGYLDRNEVPACECEGWKIGYCNYGRPSTRIRNSSRKWTNSECCGNPAQMKRWAKEEPKEVSEGV